MRFALAPFCALFITAAQCEEIKITAFSDTDTFLARAEHIVIAKCLGPVPDPSHFDDGLYPVDVDVIAVLHGPKNKTLQPGKTRIATIYRMEAGKTYLLMSMGGSAHGTTFLAIPELSVVELPPTFRLDDLKGKTVKEQVQALFALRREEAQRQRQWLDAEIKLLDKAR